jgi:AcrR family transcriptional regulator
MTEAVLTIDRILDAAEDVLRRFGPAKATVVDVARALGVSHGSVYRHFGSKAELRDAVASRWLNRVSAPLDEIAYENGPAKERLRRWLDRLIKIKHSKVLDDPELFATYTELAADAREVAAEHVSRLAASLARIVEDGIERGEFAPTDPAIAGRAVLHATSRFHHPANAGEWSSPTIGKEFEAVWRLVLHGLEGA